MALLEILHYPDPRLRTQAAPVTDINDDIRTLVNDMAETMYAAPGIGLAATQINVHKQLIIIDISETRDQLQVFINPEILSKESELTTEEGCLSVPGIYEAVTRAETITYRAQDAQGNKIEESVSGLLAVCIQHEIDHLKGKVFVDYLSRLKQQRISKKLLKQQRQAM
ncbi:MAG: peptide deformylase [Acidiferrobacterales bacterium]